MKIKNVFSSTLLSAYYLFLTTRSAIAQNVEDGLYDPKVGKVATIGWIVPMAKNILSVAITLIGISTLIMLLIGGIKILTSGGNPEAMESGKKTLTMAIGGLVLAVFIWFIFNILNTVLIDPSSGTDLTTFTLPYFTP